MVLVSWSTWCLSLRNFILFLYFSCISFLSSCATVFSVFMIPLALLVFSPNLVLSDLLSTCISLFVSLFVHCSSLIFNIIASLTTFFSGFFPSLILFLSVSDLIFRWSASLKCSSSLNPIPMSSSFFIKIKRQSLLAFLFQIPAAKLRSRPS